MLRSAQSLRRVWLISSSWTLPFKKKSGQRVLPVQDPCHLCHTTQVLEDKGAWIDSTMIVMTRTDVFI